VISMTWPNSLSGRGLCNSRFEVVRHVTDIAMPTWPNRGKCERPTSKLSSQACATQSTPAVASNIENYHAERR
jgi:hypothetical protein